MNNLLFDEEDMIPWMSEWQDMPEYICEDLSPKFQLIVNFSCASDAEDFARLLSISYTPRTGRQLQSVWFPSQEIGRIVNKRYIDRSGQ